jgi:membrane-bound lytic murein transglycosylase D
MIKLILLSFFALIFLTTSDPYYAPSSLFRASRQELSLNVREIDWARGKFFGRYLKDHDRRVSPAFRISPYFHSSVNFWFLIYTHFESDKVLIHDKTNLSLVYTVLDFQPLHRKNISPAAREMIKANLIQKKVKQLRRDLLFLSKNPLNSSHVLLKKLRSMGVKLPSDRGAAQRHLKNLAKNLRTQTGQKNFIKDGIIRSVPYNSFLKKYFADHNLPPELLALPFLESSFNPGAHSKAQARGVWQFMPLIASYYVPQRSLHVDYRSNIGVSSLSAAHLLRENFHILKRWDLAVTAYNSGTKHLLRSKKRISPKGFSLENIIRHSGGRHFGFASTNFYSEFLALVHALAYKDQVFTDLQFYHRHDHGKDLHFYLAKCKLRLPDILSHPILEEVRFYNHQITDLKRPINRGAILTLKSELPSTKFHRLSYKHLLQSRPKDWQKILGKIYNCSTR